MNIRYERKSYSCFHEEMLFEMGSGGWVVIKQLKIKDKIEQLIRTLLARVAQVATL